MKKLHGSTIFVILYILIASLLVSVFIVKSSNEAPSLYGQEYDQDSIEENVSSANNNTSNTVVLPSGKEIKKFSSKSSED